MKDDTIKKSDVIDAVKIILDRFSYKEYSIGFKWAMSVIETIPSADRPQEWISCSERLPEYMELVNVTTRDLRVKLAYLDSIQEDGTDDFWTMPLDDANCALWNIVAWMPLPEPWKGADDEMR